MTPHPIADVRKALGLSQAAMARALGVHRSTWVKWEREERFPDRAALRLIFTLRWLHSIGKLPAYLNEFLD